MMKATTLSIWCITTTIIIIIIASSSSSYAFVSTLNYNSSPRAVTSFLAQTQHDEENASISLQDDDDVDTHRRTLLLVSLLCCQPTTPSYANNNNVSPTPTIHGIHDPNLQNYINPLLPHYKGTALPGPLSLSEAYSQLILPSLLSQNDGQDSTTDHTALTTTTTTFPMGKWPDPILRIPSSPIPPSTFSNKSQLNMLQSIANTLKHTARKEGAVGLAAQQCGIDVSLIYIDGIVVDTTTASSSSSSNRNDQSSYNNGRSALGGVFGQSNWRNSKKQLTGEGALLDNDDYTNHNRSSNNTPRLLSRMGKQPPLPMRQEQGIFLVNPRIIHRSPESEMLVWTEECLVLPPEFRATLLRDAEVTIEYETLTTTTTTTGVDNTMEEYSCGETKQITLRGEFARCVQHEMDHDRGVLIVDHVGLEDLLSINGQTLMEDVENSDGRHAERMQRAYARDVSDSVLLPSVRTHRNVDLAFGTRNDFLAKKVDCVVVESDLYGNDVRHPWFVESANAVESVTNTNDYSAPSSSRNAPNTRPENVDNGTTTISCDDACLEDRKRRIQQRRAMMQQSRSATNRGDVLELSRQRALMYGTSYKGLSPGTCAKPGFCP